MENIFINEPRVSIIIPVYNMEKYLSSSLESALSQTYRNIEIILVDDGSKDRSPDICDAYLTQNDQIICIHKENGGLSSARNAGIDTSSGEYVLFFDADDILVETAVETLVQEALRTGADAVYPSLYIEKKENGESERILFDRKFFTNDPREFYYKILVMQGRAWRSTALLYSARVIKENFIRYPEGIVGEDFFFNADFLLAADKIACISCVTLKNVRHKGSISTSYVPNYYETILKVDKRVQEDFGEPKYRAGIDYLYMRNLCMYAFKVMSSLNLAGRREKNRQLRSMYQNERTMEAVRDKYIYKYRGKREQLYIITMACLIRIGAYGPANLIAGIIAKIIL